MNTRWNEDQSRAFGGQHNQKNSYLIRQRSQELLARVARITQQQHTRRQRVAELNERLDSIARRLEMCREPINTCLDFIPFATPPAQANWAIVYVYTKSLTNGCYLSAN